MFMSCIIIPFSSASVKRFNVYLAICFNFSDLLPLWSIWFSHRRSYRIDIVFLDLFLTPLSDLDLVLTFLQYFMAFIFTWYCFFNRSTLEDIPYFHFLLINPLFSLLKSCMSCKNLMFFLFKFILYFYFLQHMFNLVFHIYFFWSSDFVED